MDHTNLLEVLAHSLVLSINVISPPRWMNHVLRTDVCQVRELSNRWR